MITSLASLFLKFEWGYKSGGAIECNVMVAEEVV